VCLDFADVVRDVSKTVVEISAFESTRGNKFKERNPLTANRLSPEVTHHHQLEKIALLVFDSRLVHQFLNITASIVCRRCSQHRRPGLLACHRASSIGDSPHSERTASGTIGLVQKMD
jgi:hypothetical protein